MLSQVEKTRHANRWIYHGKLGHSLSLEGVPSLLFAPGRKKELTICQILATALPSYKCLDDRDSHRDTYTPLLTTLNLYGSSEEHLNSWQSFHVTWRKSQHPALSPSSVISRELAVIIFKIMQNKPKTATMHFINKG